MNVKVADLAELRPLVGEHLGSSNWIEITQDLVNVFADATGDRQWIHVDPDRATREGPFGGPVAHGFLTLSLFSDLCEQVLTVENLSSVVNYGLNKVRFPAPVPIGSKVRLDVRLASFEDIAGGAQIALAATTESDRSPKPVCVAEVLLRLYR